MRVRADPAMKAWAPSGDAPVWTGHQLWLWHPGILAKYLAADALSDADTPAPVHLVVDHDTQDALRLELPTQQGNALSVRRMSLAPTQPDVPAACQPAASTEHVLKELRGARQITEADLSGLLAAFDQPEVRDAENLGQQLAAVLDRLMRPWLRRPGTVVFSSALHREAWFADELHTLLRDAASAVRHYNAAVSSHPGAGVAPLRVEPDRVELPAWLLGWEKPRRRVFADMADSDPWLVTEAGERVDPDQAWLAPRALWMTALLRRRVSHCAGFIHGTGGGEYDRAMEAWWSSWRGEPLAPQAVVTADLPLSFRAPVNGAEEVTRAVWLRHHLPHNLDRVPSVAAAHPDLVAEKRRLLERMEADRDKTRRRNDFDRIHTINDALIDAHHALLDRAETELRRARTGLTNARIARKRDWCFALYPDAALQRLSDTIRERVHPAGTPAGGAMKR